MSRLAIALDDSWTRNKRTRIHVAGGELSGCGISLDVWQHLFDFHDGSWCAAVHGESGDNLTMVSLERENLEQAPAEPSMLSADDLESPNVSALAAKLPLRSLSPALMRHCGFERFEDVVAGGPVLACLHMHDDFIFTITRKSAGLVADALRLVVRVHQHYLGMDLTRTREDEATATVLAILEREGDIELQSKPHEHGIQIAYEHPGVDWLSRLFKRRQKLRDFVSFANAG